MNINKNDMKNKNQNNKKLKFQNNINNIKKK